MRSGESLGAELNDGGALPWCKWRGGEEFDGDGLVGEGDSDPERPRGGRRRVQSEHGWGWDDAGWASTRFLASLQ